MSLQYAKKQISDIQKSITFLELKWINKAVNEFNPGNKIKFNRSSDQISINIDLCNNEIEFPLSGIVKIDKTDSSKKIVSASVKTIDKKVYDKVHLWEAYLCRRKRVISSSLLVLFTLFFTVFIGGVQLIFYFFPDPIVKADNNLISLSDSLNISGELNLKLTNMNNKGENMNIIFQHIFFIDTLKNINDSSHKVISSFDVQNKQEHRPTQESWIKRFLPSIGIAYFLILYPIVTFLLCFFRIKILVDQLFGKDSLYYTNPDLE